MSDSDPWTITRLLTWTTDYLKSKGSESPRLDAEVLLAHVRQCDRIHLYTAYDETASQDERDRFRGLVKQRAEGTPVAYLVGSREFFSLEFHVTRDVLIPRPESEYLVTSVLDLVRESHRDGQSVHIADVGTGSGALAVSVAVQLSYANLTAIDISSAAIEVARKNAETHGVSDRIQFVESDLFAKIPDETKFDHIVSNPPYIGELERPDLPREVRDHEPALALFAGDDGLQVIGPLVAHSAEHLKPSGWLLFEISPNLEEAVRDIVEADSNWTQVSIIDDLAGHARVLKAQRVSA